MQDDGQRGGAGVQSSVGENPVELEDRRVIGPSGRGGFEGAQLGVVVEFEMGGRAGAIAGSPSFRGVDAHDGSLERERVDRRADRPVDLERRRHPHELESTIRGAVVGELLEIVDPGEGDAEVAHEGVV